MSRRHKADGRRERRYTMAVPPAAGVVIERVDDHTATIRTAHYLPDEDLSFLRDVLRQTQLDRVSAILGVPDSDGL